MHPAYPSTLLVGLLALSLGLSSGCDSSTNGDGDGAGEGGSKPGRPFGEVTETMAEYITPDAACETHDVACLLPCPMDDLYVAINPTDYAGSEACGACMEVTGPLGTVTVSVIENCAGACADGEIELSEAAFAQIADVSEGQAAVSWRLVSCSHTGPIAFHFEPESSEWWVSIQVRNHVMPVRSVAVQTGDGGWIELERRAHNYFDSNEAGPGPYTLRVRSIDDQELIETGIALSPDGLVQGQGQFQ